MKVNKPFMLGILSLAASLSTVASALAANPYPSAYDATYKIVDNKGTSTSHKLSDGMGHTRTDTTMGTGQTIMITDLTTNTVYVIMELQKLITKGPYKGGDGNEAGALLADLGTKTIDGRTCTGKLESVKGGTKETWSDKTITIPVRVVFSGGGTTRQSDLTSLSTSTPDPSNFQIPTTGYTMMNKP